ncbi:MAG: hypothetical protein HYU77_15490 [Betaproteobacteria bacterium]|nr:hypothetical protein [Betaproteobacteria bacterium]
MMRWLWRVLLFVLTLSLPLAAAPAVEGYVKTMAPTDGAKLERKEEADSLAPGRPRHLAAARQQNSRTDCHSYEGVKP